MITETLSKTLSNTDLWAAIISTIGIIALGFILVKVKVFKQEWKGILNSIVLKVALPALALTGFMSNISIEQLKEEGVILGVGFAFYIVFNIIALTWVKYFPKLLPKKFNKQTQLQIQNQNGSVQDASVNTEALSNQQEDTAKRGLVMWMMLIFGSTTFFGLPIIRELYPSDGVIAANLWNVPYRVFLYSLCFMVMSGLKFDKQNIAKSTKTALLNPIVICTFLGIVLWLTQLIPGASDFGKNFVVLPKNGNGWFNWKVTMPYFHKPISTIGSLSSPLVWLSIGITLAGTKLVDSVKNPWVWLFSFQKLVIIPLIVFLIMLGLVWSGSIGKTTAIPMLIFASTPPATVVVAYSMQYKVCEKFASQCSALATLLAIIFIPLWIIIGDVAFSAII
ncbi:AEC family transporter [Mycoplasma sp. E35C]|uniref:AEC family transporter n=1 Tax=Mycoplasma sp. E35C TaxID=2801918 RepID=UPI001CA3A414|nr:AEC family transporter [Mycoplasma sp. E35C]QZX49466.1 AEC family transporter [Mycoplasma sp. E35C]